MNRLAAVFLIGLFSCAVPTPAFAKWTRLTSPHFVFVGDTSDRELRDMARRLEQFREVVERVFSDRATSSQVPTTVVVFQNERSFLPFKPVFDGKPVAVAGYFTGSEDANYIAVNAEQDSAAYGVIFHEYAHFLIRNSVSRLPLWANEGLAQFYQTFESRDGGKTAMIGIPDTNSLQRLAASTSLMPIAELIAVGADSPLYNEGDRRGLFYAESWALVHYLTFGGPRRNQLRQYIAAIGAGAPDEEAFTKAFGPDRAVLERELQRYIRSFGLKALRLEFDAKVQTGTAAPAEVISDAEAEGYLGDMIARLNRIDDARAYLKKTLDASPESARATAALGLLELRESNVATAFPLLERAAALAPGTASVQAAYGRALTRRADRGGADEGDLYAKARTVLARALELEPDNVSTLVTLAEVEMASGDNPARGLALMQRAVTDAPGREEYRLMLAQGMAMNRDYRGAANVLGLLVARGSRPEVRTAAREALTRVAAAENAARRITERATEVDRATDDADPSSPVASAARPDEPRRPDAPQGVFVPALRPVQAGEARVLGTFSSVDCRPGAIVLQVDTAGGPVRMAVQKFDEVEFLSYRQDAPGSVPCGPQRPAYRVLATFRTDAQPLAGANTANHAVAIELLPDGYTPR